MAIRKADRDRMKGIVLIIYVIGTKSKKYNCEIW
jgi:hypothetical protein